MPLSYEQAKDQIAKKYDWRDWNELLYWHDKPENSFQKEDVDKYYTPKAAELYADSVAREAVNEAWKQFSPRPIDVKLGWNNNAKILEEIVTDINNEIYVEDENEMMEYIDHALVSIKKRFLEYQPKP